MKKTLSLFILTIITLFLISCSPTSLADLPSSPVPDPSPQPSVSDQSLPEIKETTTTITPPPSLPPVESEQKKSTSPPVTLPPPNLTTPPSTEKVKSSPANLSAKVRTIPPILPPPPTITAFDSFTGSTIDTSKYNTQLTGNASLTQNDNILMQGNSNNGISWVSIYTTKKYNIQDEYNLSVDVNFNGSISEGSAHAVLGLETLPILTESKNPERNYCELRLSRDDKILRLSKTINHLDLNTPLSGTLNLFWSKKLGKSTCTFNGQTITQYQEPQTGEYYGSIRSGINYVTEGGGIETSGTGNYEATFDNFFIKQN